MNHCDPKHVLCNIQKLFPRQIISDAVEIFLIQRIKEHSKSLNGPNQNNWIDLGDNVVAIQMIIQPIKISKVYTGKEICELIIDYINEQYWLVLLWELLYEDSKNSIISREIVRAFVKHCVSTIAKNLILYGPRVITCNNINDKCFPDKIKFYKTIFSYTAIIKEMRLRIKKRMKHYSMNKIILDNNVNIHPDKLIELFNKFNLKKYSNLIRKIQNEHTLPDKRIAINVLPNIYSLINRFAPASSQILKEIKKLSLEYNENKKRS